ncbi:MAG: ComF family protein, partial [Piscirickettsiaceae bacterium]|nr:ComF family protein [Piscirickettsiaceae bacterium]
IDDVVTTGHTADMAEKIFIEQGVKKVELWTIARTIRDHA